MLINSKKATVNPERYSPDILKSGNEHNQSMYLTVLTVLT